MRLITPTSLAPDVSGLQANVRTVLLRAVGIRSLFPGAPWGSPLTCSPNEQ